MKIIQICPKSPIPADDGGKIAMLEIAYGLNEVGVVVKQLIFETAKNPFSAEHQANYPFEFRKLFLDTRVTVWGGLRNLFSSKSYQLNRFENAQISQELQAWLDEEPVDLIQAESIYALASVIPVASLRKIPVFLRAHNVEFIIWERLASQTKNPLKKWYLHMQASRLKKEELYVCRHVEGIVAISEEDKKILQSHGVTAPIEVIGISTALKPASSANQDAPAKDLFHLGSMDWAPNREGIDWFIEKVWPQIRQKWPKLEFVLAGKSMPERYSKKSASGIYTAIAENSAHFMAAHGMMIVPLWSGSGIRVKLIEGLALGKVIIATSIAAEGIPVTNGKHLLIADTPEEMMFQIGRCLTDAVLVSEISKNAVIFAQEQFSRKRLTEKLLSFYHERTLH
jgi:glycosyltransferase involved in cell wall biosynthesis